MTEERKNILTLVMNKTKEKEFEEHVEVPTYQSNPMKTDLYARLSAFTKSQKKYTIKDVINDSLK